MIKLTEKELKEASGARLDQVLNGISADLVELRRDLAQLTSASNVLVEVIYEIQKSGVDLKKYFSFINRAIETTGDIEKKWLK